MSERNAANSTLPVADIFLNVPEVMDRTERRYEAAKGIREDPFFNGGDRGA
jgi:hypothetical protein